MKKILVCSALLIFGHVLYGQSIRVGVKGTGNTTWLLNQNVFDTDEELDHSASFGVNGGISATYMFNDLIGLSLDVMYASVNQNYKGEAKGLGVENTYVLKEKLRYIELPLLFKITSKQGPYFEIGPKLSLLTGHREELKFDNDAYQIFNTSGNFKNDFNPLQVAATLGFGVDINIAPNMYINVGLRLAYGITDALKQHSDAELQADLGGKDPQYTILQRYSSYDSGDYSGGDQIYKYKRTHIATGGLLIGYSYSFGGKAK